MSGEKREGTYQQLDHPDLLEIVAHTAPERGTVLEEAGVLQVPVPSQQDYGGE
jgi:hypothetical protein